MTSAKTVDPYSLIGGELLDRALKALSDLGYCGLVFGDNGTFYEVEAIGAKRVRVLATRHEDWREVLTELYYKAR